MNGKQPSSSHLPACIINLQCFIKNKKKTFNFFFQDNIPELQEGFIINITDVGLIISSSGGQPSVKRLGLEIAEITIEENDDARGIFNFNVTKVNKSE